VQVSIVASVVNFSHRRQPRHTWLSTHDHALHVQTKTKFSEKKVIIETCKTTVPIVRKKK
jgi:hypothetical protein